MQKDFYPLVLSPDLNADLLRLEPPTGWIRCEPQNLQPGDEILLCGSNENTSFAFQNPRGSLILSVIVIIDDLNVSESLIQINHLLPTSIVANFHFFLHDVIYRRTET